MPIEERNDSQSTEKIQRMIRPELLKKNERLKWSTGTGTAVWELFCASISGQINTALQLLEEDPSLVRSSYDYRQPLYFAVRENQLPMATLLLQKGADPTYSFSGDNLLTIASDRGYSDMHKLLARELTGPNGDLAGGEAIAKAIREGDLKIVKTLLDKSPEWIHAGDMRNNQPIHWAVMTRRLDIIDELLDRGADINARRCDGAHPVQLVNGDYHFRGWAKEFPAKPSEVLEHLRVKGAYIDICTAAYTGDLERIKILVTEEPGIANRVSEYVTYYLGSGAPLKNAAANGHMEIVKYLLENGADPNLPEEGIAPNGHALHSAVCSGHLEIVQLLLDHGAYPNVDIESSADTLMAAIMRKNQPMVDLLCSHGASSAMHLLAYYGEIRTAAAVLAADPSRADDPYALECAASEGHDAFVRLLLRYQPTLASRIAVGVANQGPQGTIKSRELAEFLFRHGMDPNLPNWIRISPLHRFAGRGDLESAALFIDHGANINARDEDINSTPLGWAAKSGKLPMVELLLERGALPNLPDDPIWARPLAWAMRRGHSQITELLIRHGAQ